MSGQPKPKARRGWTAVIALAVILAALVIHPGGARNLPRLDEGWPLLCLVAAIVAALAGVFKPGSRLVSGSLIALGVLLGALAPLFLFGGHPLPASAAAGLWLYVLALTLLMWCALETLAEVVTPNWIGALVVPGLFGLWLVFLWQVLVVGLSVPAVLLPSPDRVEHVFVTHLYMLWQDFRQTFLKAVLSGFVIGSGAGFLVAILADRVSFLRRGLLPLGYLMSAVPIVGIAPIMVMWFGFDWQSKAAVVVVMTFFPMLVNTLAGIHSAEAIEHDLMHSYGASYAQTLLKLRLPNALPFIFNALKINSTLALIGAIVAEFFGTPVVGMGFRILVEIGRMNMDMVWATIVVAALAGSMFYGALALLERGLTFWHPSYRQERP